MAGRTDYHFTAPAYGVTPTYTVEASSNLVLKSGAGVLYGFDLYSTVAGFVLLFDAAALPADGAVTPIRCYPISINSILMIGYTPPLRFSSGLVIGLSTTGPFVLTKSASAYISGDVE